MRSEMRGEMQTMRSDIQRLDQKIDGVDQKISYMKGELVAEIRRLDARIDGATLLAPSGLQNAWPRRTVEYAIFVARATMVMPPRPAARASVAAQIRRARSVNAGAKALYFALQSLTSTHPAYWLGLHIRSLIL